jgi:hypothetical protein
MTRSGPSDPWEAVERQVEQENARDEADWRQLQHEAAAVAERISGYVGRFLSEVRRQYGPNLQAAINAQSETRITFTPEHQGHGSYFYLRAGGGWAHWTTTVQGSELYVRLDGVWRVNHLSGTEYGGFDNCVFGFDDAGRLVLSRAAFAHTSPQRLEQDILNSLVRGSRMPWRG